MDKSYDIVVIGAGPAGLSAASYAARAGYKTIALDAMAPGGQLMFIAEIENYPGVEKLSGMALAEELEKQAVSFGAEIGYSEVLSIEKNGKGLKLNTADGDIEAKAVILAMGAKHRRLEVPGEADYEGRGVSYCATCDGPFFKDKKVMVVGGGDTALTDALYLSKIVKDVVLVHRRDEFRAQKVLQDRVRATENITLALKHTVKSINGDGSKVVSVTLDDDSEINCDGIFIFTGIIPTSSLVKDIAEVDDKGFIITGSRMETSVPGLFAVGDVRNTPFRQVVTAAGDGAIAAHAADEYISDL